MQEQVSDGAILTEQAAAISHAPKLGSASFDMYYDGFFSSIQVSNSRRQCKTLFNKCKRFRRGFTSDAQILCRVWRDDALYSII